MRHACRARLSNGVALACVVGKSAGSALAQLVGLKSAGRAMSRLRVRARVYVTKTGSAGAGSKPFAPVPGKWGPEVERDVEAHEPTVGGARDDGEDAPRAPSREVCMGVPADALELLVCVCACSGVCPCESVCVRAAGGA